jgi:phage-related holin
MNTWFLFAVISQFMFAVCVLIDRFIVTKGVVSKPVVYAFYVSFMSVFALVALPFGVSLPSGQTILLSLAVAISYLISIIF